MNEYFTNTSNPQPNSSGSSSLIRAEFASIKAGFDKLPTIAGNGGEFVRINAGATALETTGDVVASLTVAATGKTTPVDADLVPLVDSEASNVLKKLTWANLKATLKTYFDSVTTTLTNKTLTTPVLSNPSYSGTTANGGTVTTIDINGGTIDGAVIGGSSAAAGSFTTLNASGANEAVTSYGVSPLYLYCTTAFGIDVGPSLGFYGKADGGAATQFGNISARKENATSGNTAGYLSFATRVHGSTPTEKMRISSTGAVTIPGSLSSGVHTITNGANWKLGYNADNGASNKFLIRDQSSGVNAIQIDGTAGAVTIPGTLSLTGGTFGYGTGAGGTVTQASTSGKATDVTLNKPSGVITTDGAALNGWTEVGFYLYNSYASVNDVCILSISGDGKPTNYSLRALMNTGYIRIVMENITSFTRSEVVVINYAIVKVATS